MTHDNDYDPTPALTSEDMEWLAEMRTVNARHAQHVKDVENDPVVQKFLRTWTPFTP